MNFTIDEFGNVELVNNGNPCRRKKDWIILALASMIYKALFFSKMNRYIYGRYINRLRVVCINIT